MQKSIVEETDPRVALENTDRRLRILLKQLGDAGVADSHERLELEVKRSRRQTRANRKILGRETSTTKKGK